MARNTLAPGGYVGGEPPRKPYFNQLSGVWKLEDVVDRQKAGTWANPLGIEDLFSTWLYTGNGSTQTITNGIDLAGKGGMVWTKCRDVGRSHILCNTANGAGVYLESNFANALTTDAQTVTSFANNGYSIGTNNSVNFSGNIFTSWTFRKAAKFFDVVTYTGNGTAGRTVAHSLGSVPGCVIVKCTSTGTTSWAVYHTSIGAANGLRLETTEASFAAGSYWNGTSPTSTVFTVGANGSVNASGSTYVAYLFAHDAGGFGDSGNESVIKCGSFTADALEKATVDLGWEPQWLLFKPTSATGDWHIVDNMRRFPVGTDAISLKPNLTSAEANFGAIYPTSTGFAASSNLQANQTYIYIAIRRGPMKAPTDATKVFAASTRVGAGGVATEIPSGGLPFSPDFLFSSGRSPSADKFFVSRLTDQYSLSPTSTAAEAFGPSNPIATFAGRQNTVGIASAGSINSSFTTYVDYFFRRFPGFFDVVAYTGTGIARTVAHNLGVAPELMIVKSRSGVYNWRIYASPLGPTKALVFGIDSELVSSVFWNDTSPTSSVFSLGTSNNVNLSSGTYIAYLFATCPGVSKVGSYTGTGTTLDIDCGFSNGARFVLIKRTDSTGAWYFWDTARGIVTDTDPYMTLNTTTLENSLDDYIDPLSSGFQISSTAPAAINANGGSFIFLAIA